MDLLRKYLIPLYEAPDANAGTETPPVLPAATVDPAADAPPAPDVSAPRKMVSEDVLIREITPLRAAKRELESELAQARREAADAKALAERLQAGKTEPPREPNGQFTARIETRAPAAVDETEIDRRAAEKVFQRDAQLVSETGFKTYGQGWVDAVNALNAYGINSSEFVGSVMEIDRNRAHEIMHAIAQDGEKAIALANMSPARRIAEITKISMTTTEPVKTAPAAPPAPAKTVSKAPAPPPPVDPSASKVVDGYSDDATEEQFTEQFNRRMKERAGMRR